MAVKLPQSHRSALEKAQAICAECAVDIARAQDAGVDLGNLPAIRDQMEERIHHLLRVYFRGPSERTRYVPDAGRSG